MSPQTCPPHFEVGASMGIECRASRGVLPHEVGIVIQGVDRQYESLVEDTLVNTPAPIGPDEQIGTIEARIVQVNGETLLVELPRQVVSGGRRIWIQKPKAV